MIELRVQKSLRLTNPGFSAEDMRAIGAEAVRVEGLRWAAGLDLSDQPARPLAPRYAKRKARFGQRPIRNLRLTGSMAAARQVVGAELNRVQIEFVGAEARRRANENLRRNPMIGLSPMDQAVVASVARQIIESKTWVSERAA